MKKIQFLIFFFIVSLISFYFYAGCKENSVEPVKQDLGILRTDEIGNVLGGDYSDWCIHSPADSFTHVIDFIVAYPQNPNIAVITWKTCKQYHLYGFFVQRNVVGDTAHTDVGFVQGYGTTNDTLTYSYTDTLQAGHPAYLYRLKVQDIYGNISYAGGIILVYPLPNASFGPAFPNPSTTSFKINIQIPRTDTLSLYFADGKDSLFYLKDDVLLAGGYQFNITNDSNFHNVQKRLYLKSRSIVHPDSCSLYGDIQFN